MSSRNGAKGQQDRVALPLASGRAQGTSDPISALILHVKMNQGGKHPPVNFKEAHMNRPEKDFQIRRMAQDAKLDEDVESMVPPTVSSSTYVVMIALLCVILVAALVVVLSFA